MIDRQVSATMLLAATLWSLSVVLVGASFVVGLVASPLVGVLVGNVGLLAAAAALGVTVRGWLVRHLETSRAAFNLGREVGAEDGRQIRSVH